MELLKPVSTHTYFQNKAIFYYFHASELFKHRLFNDFRSGSNKYTNDEIFK